MDVPAKAEVGATKAQPAGTPGPTAATPNEPAKARSKSAAVDAALTMLQSTERGRAMLQKISEVCETDRKKKEKEEEEAEKEASAADILTRLAHVLS